MKITMSSEMGIHAVWFLATLEAEKPVFSAIIAKGINVSESYLIKVLKRLVADRIISSRKGKKGGYLLRRPPSDITLAEIVNACEGNDAFYTCLCEERGCREHLSSCPVHAALARAAGAMTAELEATSVADLLGFGWPSPLPESAHKIMAKEK